MTHLIIPPDQRFECTLCGRCCRAGWNVEVQGVARARLRASYLPLKVEQEKGVPALIRQGARVRLGRRGDECVFLDGDLCSIHRELGPEAKPTSCRQFPFLLQATPVGVVVGASFYCPSIRENTGRPLEAYREELEELARELRLPTSSEVLWAEGSTLSWDDYVRLETVLLDAFDVPVVAAGLLRRWVASGDLFFPVDLPSPAVEQTRSFLKLALIARLEREGPAIEPFLKALAEDQPVSLERHGWSGRPSEVSAYGARVDLRFMATYLDRYFRALLQRKYLVTHAWVASNLLLLCVLPDLIEWYTCVFALARGAGEPEPADVHGAVDLVELDVATHARDDDLLCGFTRLLLRGQTASAGRPS